MIHFKIPSLSAAQILVPWLILAVMSESTQAQPPRLLEGLAFRSIGPAVAGGRIHDIEVDPKDPATIYLATATGGLWKSTNKGAIWVPIFDEQAVSTFGDMAISSSNPEVLWAGTGEQNNRQSTSWGNGIYRSVDAGMTWSHEGLTETRHIGRVLVHPSDPDVVFVAALGNLWRGSAARGVYKTSDGGQTWEKVLYIDEFTGAVDLVMHPENPEILYAATYQRMRRTWGFNGGGPGSGLFKTTDGGETWSALAVGLPEGDKGRIGLAISESNPEVLYATIEHARLPGTYRSNDGGDTWAKVNDLNPRPMYYSHILVDPTDEDRVFVLATEFYMSEDGGKNFAIMPTRPTYDVGVHADHHALWIDRQNSRHLYLAGDGGLHESWDRGKTFIRYDNLPIGQFYAIGLDMRKPYRVYGGLQDNHSWSGPSATRRWTGIVNDDWTQIGFGDGMYQQVDPYDNRDVYSSAQNGVFLRVDSGTGDLLDIRPTAPDGEHYRFDWVTPHLSSMHRPGTVYLGGNRLFISHNRGVSWSRTKDLSREINRDELTIMGVRGSNITLSRNDGVASYGEITTISESPLDPMVLWIGTDDGNVQVSRDGGASWKVVVPQNKDVPDGTYVSRVVASGRSVDVAYAVFDAHRDGDFKPYVYGTEDAGETWTALTRGLPLDGSTNTLVEHPKHPSLLFLGTEHGLFVSFSAGKQWMEFNSNLPTTLIDDIKIHPRDNALVVGTHGRSIWILDHISPLQQWDKSAAAASIKLFDIPDFQIRQLWKTTSYRGHGSYSGTNPSPGTPVSYYLADTVDSVRIVISTPHGEEVRKLTGPGEAGTIHRIVWDGRHAPPPHSPIDPLKPGLRKSEFSYAVPGDLIRDAGPYVSPGIYHVSAIAGTSTRKATVRVFGDSGLNLTIGDEKSREDFLLGVSALHTMSFDYLTLISELLDSYQPHRLKTKSNPSPDPQSEARIDMLRTRERSVKNLVNDLLKLSRSFNGNAVRQGSMHPPTAAHLSRRNQLKLRLDQELLYKKELESWQRALR